MRTKEFQSKVFPDQQDMFDRFATLKAQDPYIGKRELYLKNYNRQAWKRTTKADCKKTDPNWGQFKFKTDAAMNTFVQVLTERNANVKITPKYPKEAGLNLKLISDKITSAFHKFFIRPKEDRFIEEILASFDMVFYGKAAEHWPTPGCVYSENIPIENLYPDTNAGMNTKKWSYFFMRKHYTIAELYSILENTDEDKKDLLTDFNKEYLKEILDDEDSYSKYMKSGNADKEQHGEYTSGNDRIFPIIYCYIKDNFDSDKPISMYAFPEQMKDWKEAQNTSEHREMVPMKTLINHPNFCECISYVIAIRAYQISRSYWKFNSFAQQIYLATAMYDKSMSLAIRAMKRSAILYWSSDSPDTQKKLLNQNDEEVQVVDPSVALIQTGQHSNNIRDITEMLRQIMIDTENGQSLAQAPGSQNVKGYAITAQEAQIRNQKSGESEALNIKVLMNLDCFMYKEMYRRAMNAEGKESKKALKCFKDEMKLFNIDPYYYDYENVFFTPSFINGGSASSRIANAQAVLETLRTPVTSPGQEQAQRDLVGAIVGVDNVDAYITERIEINPIAIKVGGENEDMDNAYCNPVNVPVMPDDKHAQEIPMHLGDYAKKLEMANMIVQKSQQNPNRFMQLILLNSAAELVIAQDLKGAHIQAHFQAALISKEANDTLKPMEDQYKQLQAQQDQLTAQISQLTEQLNASMKDSQVKDVELDYKKQSYQMDLEHKQQMYQIDTAKEVGKYESGKEKHKQKMEEAEEKKTLDIAGSAAQKTLDLTHQQKKAQIDEQAAAQKATKPAGT